MHTVRLGRTGLKISEICLGTMTFGLQTDREEAFGIMDVAAEAGIDFIDVADVYPVGGTLETVGRTEEIVGAWLAGKRDRFVVATKAYNPMGPGPNDTGLSRRHVIAACDASLRRLQTDYIDLYYTHRWDAQTPIDETLGALDDLRRAGKIRYAGCSNIAAWQMMEALWTADRAGTVRYDAVQPRYNLLYRAIENELLPAAREYGVGSVVFNPLAGGMLTGKYKRGEAPRQGTRFALGTAAALYQARYWQDEQIDVVTRLAADLASRGKSITHVALKWVLEQPYVTAAIVGASRAEQLRDSLRALDLTLDERDRRACDDAWYALPRRRPEDER
ncbi:oxidoreductase [Vulcanimicrobium alpinum]|uniref:Oxidoreductase n=1 Tax=Vulcanimicrobium alpinum TaxID=3016050 RepID=A0AAN1XWJ8_UNVUL|nr:aldo/keto reductase [Vulcanimicrobium alpinum]BDE05856.1 oxidoreductase [Vulcanimicrobium alpinum]